MSVATITCHVCQAPRSPQGSVCENCGLVFIDQLPAPASEAAPPTPAAVHSRCPHCTQLVPVGARGCGVCGRSLLIPYERLKPGQHLAQGRYVVEQPLSKGGMGALYLAADRTSAGRTVVVKALLDYFDRANPQEAQAARERLLQEAQMLGALSFPAIPRIFNSFSEGPHTYIVMEYIEGHDLEQGLTHVDEMGTTVPGRAYDQADVLRWGIALCRVLEYLGDQQPDPIVHHDIKPANVVVGRNHDDIFLVDFGTARARLSDRPGTNADPQRPSLYGTVGYAPPEQYRGWSETRSDIYALAATLYHLSTDDDPRAHPFQFPRLQQLGDLGEILCAALDQNVGQRPSPDLLRQQLTTLLTSQFAPPIHAPDGSDVVDVTALVAWCEQHWPHAIDWLYGRLPDQIDLWWGDRALAADLRAVSHGQGSRDAGLDAALALLDPHDLGAQQPGLVAHEAALDFGALGVAGTARDLVLTNVGRRHAQARVQLPAWVTSPQVSVALAPGQQINLTLKADVRRAPAAGTLRGAVLVQDAEGSLVELEARADISRLCFFRLHHPAWWANLMLVLFLALIVLGYTGYREVYSAWHYQAGMAALQRGDWALARDEAYWMLDASGDHHDARDLLAQSYYWEGVAALSRGEWTTARSSLLNLYAVSPGFRDGTLLLKESSYQAGAVALEQGQWATAREELNRVKGYRDADILIEKSYEEAD